MLTVFFNPDDLEEVLEYRIEWNYTDFVMGSVVPVYRRQRHVSQGERWEIIDQSSVSAMGPWATIQQVDWPFPFSAVIDCQNLPNPNEYYGSPDLEEPGQYLRAINRLNFIVSDSTRRCDSRGARGTAQGPQRTEVKTSRTRRRDHPERKQKPGWACCEMASDWPPRRASTKVKEALHEIARIPEVSVGKVDNIGTLSGVALEILYQPLLEVTYVKRMTYGPLLEEIKQAGVGSPGRAATWRSRTNGRRCCPPTPSWSARWPT